MTRQIPQDPMKMMCERLSYVKPGDKVCEKYIRPKDKAEPGFCKLGDRLHCIEAIKSKCFHLSYSAVKDLCICRRKVWLKYHAGWVRSKTNLSKPLLMGILWDKFRNSMEEHGHGLSDAELAAFIESHHMDSYSFAKIAAVMRAYREIGFSQDQKAKCQHRAIWKVDSNLPTRELIVHCVYDQLYDTWFRECKFSSRPDNFLNIHSIESQVGLYFLPDDKLEYCVMEVTRAPGQKLKSDEAAGEFEQRVYQDIMARPGYYFIDYDRRKKVYGRKFWRSEFDLVGLLDRLKHVYFEIVDAADRGAWYKNHAACMAFGYQCEYLPICENRGVVPEGFERKEANYGL